MMKVVVRLVGGIGNQLFCYAAARRFALMHNAELVVDNVSGFTRDYTYKRDFQLGHFNIPCREATAAERLEPFARYRRYFKRRLNERRPFEKRDFIVQDGVDFDPRLLQVHFCDVIYMEGYWQSEGYFKDVEVDIRSDLMIKPPTDRVNLEMAEQIRGCQAVAMHVRFFDAPCGDSTNNAPDDYYDRAVAKMEALVPGVHYFLFSDQPDLARARIPLSDSRITCVEHNQGDANAYADLWLMTQCQHFIIANSSFSWWGAWLAENIDKNVIAPGFELREGSAWWGFEGLIPQSWIKC